MQLNMATGCIFISKNILNRIPKCGLHFLVTAIWYKILSDAHGNIGEGVALVLDTVQSLSGTAFNRDETLVKILFHGPAI